jgi:hypothetical protein
MKPLTNINVGSEITIDGIKHVVTRKCYHTTLRIYKYYLRRIDGVGFDIFKFDYELIEEKQTNV